MGTVHRPLDAATLVSGPLHAARPRPGLLVLAASALAGCVTYEPAPIDPAHVLADLRAVALESALPPALAPLAEGAGERTAWPPFDPSDGLSVDEAAAVAVTLNPALRAARGAAGVAAAQLVEAGLLPDPSIGWDFSESEFDALLPLLRPGERDASTSEAEARIAEVRWAILRDEWALKRDVHLAYLDLLAADEEQRLNEQLRQVASRTHEFFLRARELKVATALQETTAAIQAGEVELEGERLAVRQRRARMALNALLGLPPAAEYALQVPDDALGAPGDDVLDPEALTDLAVRQRPDLRELLAGYDRAEQRLRLAVARQWPELSVGTGIELVLPVFSRFNRPAIRTALEEREQLRREVEAAVHKLRAEVHDAVAALEQSRREVLFFATVIEPRLVESLSLAEEAFRAKQVTAGEILSAQSQVLDARVRLLAARIAHARARVMVDWVTGNNTSGGGP
jgi:outer membrane protein TolC